MHAEWTGECVVSPVPSLQCRLFSVVSLVPRLNRAERTERARPGRLRRGPPQPGRRGGGPFAIDGGAVVVELLELVLSEERRDGVAAGEHGRDDQEGDAEERQRVGQPERHEEPDLAQGRR